MKNGWSVFAASAVIGVGAVWWVSTVAFAENAASAVASEAAALSPEEETRVAALLDQVMENDQQILARCDAMMTELQIVKTRATIKRTADED